MEDYQGLPPQRIYFIISCHFQHGILLLFLISDFKKSIQDLAKASL